MKRLGWGILAFIILLTNGMPAGAIDTIATTPNKISGPFIVTGYSFSGPNLRYVQIFNGSASLASLDGWQIISTSKATPAVTSTYVTLTGQLEPGKHVIAAVPGLVDRISYALPSFAASASPLVGSVALVPPSISNFNEESVTVPNVSASTLKEVMGLQTNYYVKRETSLTTGNYLSGFAFILPIENLKNDQLYLTPQAPLLQIVEVYPDSIACSPFDVSLLCSDYVKVLNASTSSIDLSMYRLRTGTYGQASSASNTRVMNGVLSSGHYAVFPLSLSSTGSWIWLEDAYGSIRFEQSAVEYPSSTGHGAEAWAYDASADSWRWTNTPTPSDLENSFPASPPVNVCEGLKLNEVAANVAIEDQFIEIYNPTEAAIDLTGCILQTNRSSTASFVFPESELQSQKSKVIYVNDTSLTLTKTTTGTVYLLSSDKVIETDSISYAELAESTSWAYIDGSWRQTFLVTPNTPNVWLEYLGCSEGYLRNPETGNCNKVATTDSNLTDCGPGKYRSPDTNRCRSLEALATALTPCDTGQYRNPETNRCRALLSTAAVLMPCAANQERNPETNRCRAIGSSDDLKECSGNQERNPDTNRCRNKSSSITADFPVEAVSQSGEATMGWWAFGGVGTLAVGYAGWEWRREITSWVRKLLPFGIGRS